MWILIKKIFVYLVYIYLFYYEGFGIDVRVNGVIWFVLSNVCVDRYIYIFRFWILIVEYLII